MTPFRLLFRWIALTFAAVCLVLVGVLGVARKNDGWKLVISGTPLGYRLTDYASDLYWFDSNFGRLANLTRSQHELEILPTWSFNGNWLGYVSQVPGAISICVRFRMSDATCFESPVGQLDIAFKPQWLANTNLMIFASKLFAEDSSQFWIFHSLDAQTGNIQELMRIPYHYRLISLVNSRYLSSYYWQDNHSVVEILDFNGQLDRQVVLEHPIFNFVSSSDGSSFITTNYENEVLEIYLYDISSDTEELIYRDSEPSFETVSSLAWSPDGTRLAFTANYEVNTGRFNKIFVIDTVGRILFESGEYEFHEASVIVWSPDSLQIAFTEIFNGETWQANIIMLDTTTGHTWKIGENIFGQSNWYNPPAWYPQ
jgi:WD40 repeat protein